jgi:hypothetical protein
MTGDVVHEDDSAGGSIEGLVDRLDEIEEQPLASRAPSYAELQQRLRGRLEGADAPR